MTEKVVSPGLFDLKGPRCFHRWRSCRARRGTGGWLRSEEWYKILYHFLLDGVISLCRQRWTSLSFTVAHRGKTQLNFSSETQQSLREHDNLFENTTIFSRTQHFWERNKILQNTKIFFRTQQNFVIHNDLFQNKIKFSDTQSQTKTQQN